ncbi:cytochrome b/b6 domain-containing protein [Methanobacterium alcaliphilum]|uniref:cytochrome b/b6 domain-containing protein n=1 Tax=Methanobacterium alcaliphilum TaxID=392018 RepID=UPI00200A10BC|nr:cytochrome b/b6 domain-containing protein [Methanobacterium alcaliphilum]MCK9151709.1 cytochrome b/b6 domain-containing protein [Methanobacterium alcaliphilum]
MIELDPKSIFKLKKSVAYILYVLMIVMIISGLGINYHRTMEFITAGILSKGLSFNIHVWIFIPLVLVFALHTILPALKPKIKQ